MGQKISGLEDTKTAQLMESTVAGCYSFDAPFDSNCPKTPWVDAMVWMDFYGDLFRRFDITYGPPKAVDREFIETPETPKP